MASIDDEEEEARAFILARRARFVRAALAGAALTTVACECGPQVCLEPAVPPGSGGSGSADAGPQPCLTPAAAPQPCLTPMAAPNEAKGSALEPEKADPGSPRK